MHRITIIEGDGIGKEVIPVAVEILKVLDAEFEFSYASAGYECFLERGTPIPDDTITMTKNSDATLFGAVTTPPHISNYKSAIITLRKELDLFANIRPIQNDNIDLVIIRENTEGLYSGIEYQRDANTVISEKITTRKGTERIVDFALKFSREKQRKRLTLVHKANILRMADGLFREVFYDKANQYPEIQVDDMLVDTTALKLLTSPQQFDVLVTSNLFGDILSDEASGHIGGLGMAASGNIGDKNAIFEPVHGSAPDIAGKGIANPYATINAMIMMLRYLNEEQDALVLEQAVVEAIQQGYNTPDMGGKMTTKQVQEALIRIIESRIG